MSHKDVKPIFLICSPRTGSTLLQRILASHSKISSEGETHLLLPLLYAIRKEGVYSEYNHQQTFRDFSHDGEPVYVSPSMCGG